MSSTDSTTVTSSASWTIGRRIALGFAAVVCLLLCLSVYLGYLQSQIKAQSTGLTEVSVPSLEALATANAANVENQTIIYKHIYSPSQEDMADLEKRLAANGAKFDEAFKKYESLVNNEEARTITVQIRELIVKIRVLRTEIMKLSRAATTPEESAKLCVRTRAEYDPLTAKFSGMLQQLQVSEARDVENACASVNESNSRAAQGLIYGGILAVILAVITSFVIIRSTGRAMRSIADALRTASSQVSSAAGLVSSSSQSLAQGASEQAASLEETSASLEEINSMTQRNAENAHQAALIARESRGATEQGTQQMAEMVEAMSAIKSSSDNIAVIIKTIDEIAFQTNILALNAAVEAARAGEAGAGFAVVADEVRSLAQRAANAAKETATKIDDSIVKSNRGSELSARVAESLTLIASKGQQVDTLVNEIATASKEQAQGLSQIGTAISQMDQVTQKNASGAEETASAAEELNSQSIVMLESVDSLAQLVGS